eukprot:gene3133-4445_t
MLFSALRPLAVASLLISAGASHALERPPVLSLEAAQAMSRACESLAKTKGWHMNISVVAVALNKLAAVLAKGVTTLSNAACEPEIVDLAECLNKMGASVENAGTPTITITGVEKLSGTTHAVITDRIEAGTYAVAAAMAGGEV